MSKFKQRLNLPYTCMITRLRASKKECESEMTDILKQIIYLKNSAEQKSKQEILQQLRKSKIRLQTLKQKLKEERAEQNQLYNTCRKRVHLDQQYYAKKEELSKQDIIQNFDKEVIQFLASRNKIKEAKSVQAHFKDGQYFKLYIELYQKAYQIGGSIQKNDLRPLKNWCYQHSHFLAKLKSSLEFKLISCLFINILNNTGGSKAIEFLRKQIATMSLAEQDKQKVNKLLYAVLLKERQEEYEYCEEISIQEQEKKQDGLNHIKSIELKEGMDLLQDLPLKLPENSSKKLKVSEREDQDIINKQSFIEEQIQESYELNFDPISEEEDEMNKDEGGKKTQPFELVKKKKRHILQKNGLKNYLVQAKECFFESFSKIYGLFFNSYFDKTLAVGISVIKLPHCYQNNTIGNCPTCAPEIHRIMKKIPTTLKNQSSLICRINGSLMNEINYPVLLPNGQIYSVQGLKKNEKNGKYYCPAKNQWFRKHLVKKIYLT